MTQKTVPPFTPLQSNVVMETRADGTVVYKHPVGAEIETYTEDLFDLLDMMISRVRDLLMFVDDGKYQDFGYMIELLVEDTARHMWETSQLVEAAVGRITCQRISRGNVFYHTGRVVGITVTPKEEVDHE